MLKSLQDINGRKKIIILVILLVVTFLSGGSSRIDAPMLIILRPLSLMICAWALFGIKIYHIKEYSYTNVLALLSIFVSAVHLIPLSPEIWQSLSGRSLTTDIMISAGGQSDWLPLVVSPRYGWNAFYSIFTPLAVYLLALQIGPRGQVTLLLSLIVLSFVSIVVAIVQSTGFEIQLYPYNSAMSGLFANRNHQGILIACTIPMIYTATKLWRNSLRANIHKWKVFTLITSMMMAVIVVTGSRMAFLMSILSILTLPLLSSNPSMSKLAKLTKNNKKTIAVLTIMLISTLLTFIVYGRDATVYRFANVADDARVSTWVQTLGIIPMYLPWGAGIGSYAHIYQIHEPLNLLTPTYSNHAHNDWLETVLTLGLPGLTILLACVVLYLFSIRAALSATGSSGDIRRLGMVILLVFGIASAVDYPLRTPILSSIFALAVVWAATPPKPAKWRENEESDVKNC